MSGYNIEYFLGDFANRTMDNLKYIESEYQKQNLYEVTQLVNSLLGLIIIPAEAYKKTCVIDDATLKSTSISDFVNLERILERCVCEKRLYCDYKKNLYEKHVGRVCVSKFVNHIRNSIAHGGNNGIHFYPVTEDGNISAIIFYDNDEILKRNVIHEFCVKLTIEELREVVVSISNMYCKFEKKDKDARSKQKKYQSDINKLEQLMSNGRNDMTKVTFELMGDERVDSD